MLLYKGVLKICSRFTGERPCRSAILISCNFIEIVLLQGFSPVNLRHIFSTPFYKNTAKELLLNSWVSCFESSFLANLRPDEDVFCLRLQKTSSRRLQDNFIKTNIFALVKRLQKTSWSRPIYSSWSYVFKTSSRRLAKTSSRGIIQLDCSC